MSKEMIATLIVLGFAILSGIVAIVVAILRGDMKKFIVEKMEEANEKHKDLPKPEKSVKKLEYVVDAVRDKYKIFELILNVKKFIEYIVQINKKNM